MKKEFDIIAIEKAREDRPKNGNNGNYDKVGVFYDGKLVTVNVMRDD